MWPGAGDNIPAQIRQVHAPSLARPPPPVPSSWSAAAGAALLFSLHAPALPPAAAPLPRMFSPASLLCNICWSSSIRARSRRSRPSRRKEGYCKAVESFTRHRLHICHEEEWKRIEDKIVCGQVEELLEKVKDELNLIAKMIGATMTDTFMDILGCVVLLQQPAL